MLSVSFRYASIGTDRVSRRRNRRTSIEISRDVSAASERLGAEQRISFDELRRYISECACHFVASSRSTESSRSADGFRQYESEQSAGSLRNPTVRSGRGFRDVLRFHLEFSSERRSMSLDHLSSASSVGSRRPVSSNANEMRFVHR